MGIHRRTMLQALLALPVVSFANRAKAAMTLASPKSTIQTAPTPFETNLRWAMDAELTPCRHYDVVRSLTLRRFQDAPTESYVASYTEYTLRRLC